METHGYRVALLFPNRESNNFLPDHENFEKSPWWKFEKEQQQQLS